MIALWMAYAAAVGALVALAAAAAARALRLAGRPARLPWALALALTVALPAAALLLPAAPSPAPARATATGGVLTLDPRLLALAGGAGSAGWWGGPALRAPEAWRALDLPLVGAWGAASLLLALRALAAGRGLRRRMRGWPRETLDGAEVRVAPDLGPAVFGALRPEILVPQWAVRDARLPLMLAHERAHVRARDPLLLAAGLVAAVLVPWNPAAWWQLRRLRAAVELDCDARVLAADGARPAAVRAYGALLHDVAGRTAARPPVAAFAPTLLATPSTLHRRIHAMTAPRPRRAARHALPLAAGAVLLVVAACELPRPTGPRAQPNATMARLGAVTVSDRVPLTRPSTAEDVRNAVKAAMPEALERTRGARQMVWVMQAADGRIAQVVRGTPRAGSAAEMRDATVAMLDGGTYVQTSPTAGEASHFPTPEPNSIASIEVHKVGPGRILPDSTDAIWIRLKGDGATPAAPAGPERVRMRQPAPAQDRVAVRGGIMTIDKVDSAGRAVPGSETLRVNSGTERPLYVVDGVEVDGAPASLPMADRIASVEVLKGAKATEAYGARGGNGVIRITTKKD
ncbi:M56 family metallopeptidase [Roseisolibacter sp. H3M3-2]|uniref:M56 family metallopeptidase n=1 Tax=Roseisolibacter sp. H3M3-2 TaxID=3031323 RepID=UPI0023DBC263|nr:M56 family metallopeptidase [Roseisolibacter sp. H3M3-2]MDF1504749.1 M56 family metallopeptidase [Roseisolibacter sp. H3M3-2]